MDYDKARSELATAGQISSPVGRSEIVARIAAEATVDIAESLRLYLDATTELVDVDEVERPEPEAQLEAHDFIIGDRVRLVGGNAPLLYLIDAVRTDQGETAVRLFEDATTLEVQGWIYTSSLIYVDHPRDDDTEPAATGDVMATADFTPDDPEGDWHEEAVASGISALKAKADKKAKKR